MEHLPSRIHIRYLNVQHWTDDKNEALIGHLTATNPEIILFASTSRLENQTQIKIPGYITFSTNKNNERHAGVGIAIRRKIRFEIINNFLNDCIGAKIHTMHGPVIICTAYSPPRQLVLPQTDLNYMIRNNLPVILIADLNARHETFGYGRRTHNQKGVQLNRHIYNNRLNHLGPNFNTYFTRNSATKPDIVLTNNRFFLLPSKFQPNQY